MRLAAMLTALAMSLAVAVPAYAALPGESNYWSGEQANGIIAANGTIGQARNGGYRGGGWGPVETLQGATNFQPAITFNAFSDAIWVSVRGVGGGVWLNIQNLGSPNWNGWFEVGGGPEYGCGAAISTLASVGNAGAREMKCMAIATADTGGHVWYDEVGLWNYW
jgi:hypothetical protein